LLAAQIATVEDVAVKIDGKMSSVVVKRIDGHVTIMRDQNKDVIINPKYAKTSRACPPFCIQPMQVAPVVITVGELEHLEFAKAGGIIID
jgi:hypothetical protein